MEETGITAPRASTAVAKGVPIAVPVPLTVQFLSRLVTHVHTQDVVVGVSQWREAEIIATLLRVVKAQAPEAIVGRIFTAVNQDGLVVLIGEAQEPDDHDSSADAAANGASGRPNTVDGAAMPAKDASNAHAKQPRLITDCHLSLCTLDPPVNFGAPDGRMARAVMLVMIPEDDVTAAWAQGGDWPLADAVAP
jgi:hypothetical protein